MGSMNCDAMLQTTNVSFGSGGTAGFAYLGIMRALRNVVGAQPYDTWKRKLTGVAGTSAGAICALWFVLDISDDATQSLLSRVDLTRVISFVNIDQCSRRFGFSDMNEIRHIVHMILEGGGLSANATMYDLFRFTRTHTVFTASNLSTRESEYLDHRKHGDMRIDDAVCASCAIPFLYQPITRGDTILLDGCITNNIPDCFPRDDTFYVCLNVPRTTVANMSVLEYITQILGVCTAQTSSDLRKSGKKIHNVHMRHCSSFDPSANVLDITRDGYLSGLECFTGVNYVTTAGELCRCYVTNVIDPIIASDEESPPVATVPHDEGVPRESTRS